MNIILRYIIVSILYMRSFKCEDQCLYDIIYTILSHVHLVDNNNNTISAVNAISDKDMQYINEFLQLYDDNLVSINKHINSYLKNNDVYRLGLVPGIILQCSYMSVNILYEDIGLVIHEYITVSNMYNVNIRTSCMMNQIIDNISKNIKNDR